MADDAAALELSEATGAADEAAKTARRGDRTPPIGWRWLSGSSS